MNWLQEEERSLKARDHQALSVDAQREAERIGAIRPKPPARELKPVRTAVRIPEAVEPATAKPPYIVVEEIECQDCGGSGSDSGALDPEGEICSHCMGRGVETVQRNYLQEAFALIANPQSQRVPERGHLVALAQFAHRQVTDAHSSLQALQTFFPEVA